MIDLLVVLEFLTFFSVLLPLAESASYRRFPVDIAVLFFDRVVMEYKNLDDLLTTLEALGCFKLSNFFRGSLSQENYVETSEQIKLFYGTDACLAQCTLCYRSWCAGAPE